MLVGNKVYIDQSQDAPFLYDVAEPFMQKKYSQLMHRTPRPYKETQAHCQQSSLGKMEHQRQLQLADDQVQDSPKDTKQAANTENESHMQTSSLPEHTAEDVNKDDKGKSSYFVVKGPVVSCKAQQNRKNYRNIHNYIATRML